MQAPYDHGRLLRRDSSPHWAPLVLLVTLLTLSPAASASGEKRMHFDMEAGDMSVQLNEFSRQSDLQVLFDFNLVRGMRSNPVNGDLSQREALTQLLKDSGLVFDFVNDRTLAVTPKKTGLKGLLDRLQKTARKLFHAIRAKPSDAEVVIFAGRPGTDPPVAARALQFSQEEFDRSGIVTTEGFLRTRPEVFGGGANLGTVRGLEQQSNTSFGVGANFRGLGARSTTPLVNGRRLAGSGSSGAFGDISNIPLSALDHIDMIPEGGTSLFGGEAAGGVINFVFRDEYSGAQSQVNAGFASGRTLGERQVSQLWGTQWGSISTYAAVEFYRRDALAAADRPEATSDLRPWGGTNFNSVFGNPGTIMVGDQTWAIPQHQDGRSLSTNLLTPNTTASHDLNDGASILPSQERINLYTHTTVRLPEGPSVYFDALLGDRKFDRKYTGAIGMLTVPSTNPFYFNPSSDPTQPVQVLYGFLSDLGPVTSSGRTRTGNLAIGSRGMTGGWNTLGEVSYAFETQDILLNNFINFTALNAALADPNPATAFNPFGDGSHTNPAVLANIRLQDRFTYRSSRWSARVNADRIIGSMPGGLAQVFVGAEAGLDTLRRLSDASEVTTEEALSRTSFAAYSELRVPLVGTANRVPGIETLQFSLAERAQHDSDVGTVSTPSFTLSWSPIKSTRLRATESWIFRAPALGDLSLAGGGSELTPIYDTASPTGQSLVLFSFGGNRALRSERGRSWSVGLDFTPEAVPNLTLALTHFDIFMDGRIDSLTLGNDILTDPRFKGLVKPNPTPAERAAVCNNGTFFGDASACMTTPIAALVDGRLLNIARIRTRGLDFSAKYIIPTGMGTLDVSLDGTYVSQFAEALTPASPMTDLANTDHNPLSLRARGSIGYRFRSLTTAAFVNYASRYRDIDSVPERTVAAFATVDAQASYDFKTPGASSLDTLHLALSIENLFGAHPPFLNNQLGLGWDQENATPFGRIFRVTARMRW